MELKLSSPADQIGSLKKDADRWFLSPSEVDKRLLDIAFSARLPELGCGAELTGGITHQWGMAGSGITTVHTPIEHASVRLNVNQNGATEYPTDVAVQKMLHSLLEAMKSVWGNEFRTDHGAVDLKRGGALERLKDSLFHLVDVTAARELAVIYVDLDKFKALNDLLGHAEGDRAIALTYHAMHEMSRRCGGLAFRDGGDEFILIVPTSNRRDLVSALWHLRKSVRAFQFAASDQRVDMTCGVAIRSAEEVIHDFTSVRKIAEALTKNDDSEKTKKRATISFEGPACSQIVSNASTDIRSFFKLGICISRSKQFADDVLIDERLNHVAIELRNATIREPSCDEVSSFVCESLSWLGVTLTGLPDERHLLSSQHTGTSIPSAAIAVSVLHGLSAGGVRNGWADASRGGDLYQVAWDRMGRAAVLYAGKKLWGDAEGPYENVADFGPNVDGGTSMGPEGAVIGVQIGFRRNPTTPAGSALPSQFFLTHVKVDDRPRSGGGLPDFWQVALAQVIATSASVDATADILLWGENAGLSETYRHLKGHAPCSPDEMAALTDLSSERVSELLRELPSRTKLIENDAELLEHIYAAYQNFRGRPARNIEEVHLGQSVLRRPVAETAVLERDEGAVCTSANLAYPIVIDILRKSVVAQRALDDSDQEYQALTAFKLKLTDPLSQPIPRYLYDQKEEIERYTNAVLLDKRGVIRKALEVAGQMEAFVSHLAQYAQSKPPFRSTRRACLIVGNEIVDGDLRPLGLISVWAVPRQDNSGRTLLDFVFVWRTVEAFIGLPFSLFGSIKLAEELVAKVRAHAGVDAGADSPAMGALTYIALSLHLGSDEYHARVAKRIVDLASD